MGAVLLRAAGLVLGYRDHVIVRDVSFEVAQGDVFAVVGHNGAGKSTLINTLLGTLPPIAGHINWASGQPDRIAYLGQQADFDHRFPIRVRDLVAMGSWVSLGFFGRVDRKQKARIDAALERTGINEIADMSLNELSAGQLQKALFARAIVQDAPLILLDEPFAAVDQTTEAELLSLIDEWAAEGRAVILVLHDLSAVLGHCTNALLMGGGRSLFGPPGETLTTHNLIAKNYLSTGQAAWFEAMYSNAGDRHV